MSVNRPVLWVSSLLYGTVLVAGGYAGLAGLGDTQPVGFAGGLALLLGVDVLEHRRYPARTPPVVAVGLLVVRLGLIAVVTAADGSGMSRVLFLLLPFRAYFAFGLAAAVGLGAACLGLLVATFQLTVPGWYDQVERVSDLLMFAVGLVLTIAMASLAGAVATLSAAAERNRVARDIHDGLGHHLTAVSVLLEKAGAFVERDPAVARQALADAHRSARHALEDVRRSVRTLRSETEPFRLSAALDDLVREAVGDRLAVTLDWAGDERGFAPEALVALYRAAQEGVTNARRHADANRLTLQVHCGDSAARLVVADDGHGFGPGREGIGLTGMRERVRLVGGEVDIHTRPGAGTRLTVTVPRRWP